MTRKHTTITMLAAGPEGATFGAFRATVRNPDARWSWNIHRARLVGTVTVGPGERISYRAIAEQFATADWPALNYPNQE